MPTRQLEIFAGFGGKNADKLSSYEASRGELVDTAGENGISAWNIMTAMTTRASSCPACLFLSRLMSSSNTRLFALALAAAIAAPAASAANPNLPSADMYFNFAVMVEHCPATQAAARPKLEQFKRQVLGYYKNQASSLDAKQGAAHADAIRNVEAGRIPAEVRKNLKAAFSKEDPQVARFVCANLPASIESQIASAELAMAEQSQDPAARAAAQRHAVEALKAGSQSTTGSMGVQQKR